MMFSTIRISTGKKWLCLLGLALASASYAADTPAAAGGNERCIQIKDIRRTEVVDNQNILFYVRNKKIYNNHLPHRCGGLAVGNAFQYETSQSELCNTDVIRVLNSTTGELLPGASCGLGVFEPVDADKVAELKKASAH
ncbi:MAG: hypothetical protein QM709_02520 [Spongiibacteraceae bacterium]